MNFAERLKALRLEADYTLEGLGKLIGVSRSTICNYETGYRFPKREQLEAIADIFNVDMDYLLCRTDERLKYSAMKEHMAQLLDQLNVSGQQEAIKRVEELTYIPRYTAHLMPVAAHTITPYDKDDPGHAVDDAIMENEKEWN